EESRVLLNLGGMANLTWLPRGAALEQVLAFDTGPGNAVLDALAALASGGNARRDPEGAGAARGRASDTLLAELLADPFFALPPLSVLGVRPESKEALAFAFLAHQTLCGWPGNVPGATGAAHPVVLGHVTPGAAG